MSVREKVLAAKTPRDALLVLADAIDELEKPDPWADPNWGVGPEPHEVEPDQDRIAEIQRKLNEADYADEEEAQALAAELRILLDDGKALTDTAPPEGERPIIEQVGGEIVVNLPKPDEAQENMRKLFVAKVMEEDPEKAPFAESFIKGGPLLLYHSDRDYVMGLDPAWRQLFVQDVAINSPAEAQELGRDILKVEDDEMDPTLKIEQFKQVNG